MTRNTRGVTYPKDRILEQQDDNRLLQQDPFESHYISPCRLKVSNDPLTANENQCDAREYGCTENRGLFLDEIQVTYEYDLIYRLPESNYGIRDIVAYLEGAILEHLATNLGLKDCQNTRKKRRRYLQTINFSQEELDAIVSIRSDPVDQVDTSRACGTPNFFSDTACLPMAGILSVTIEQLNMSDTERAKYQDEIERIIHAGMDNNIYISGGVQQLSFNEAQNTAPNTAQLPQQQQQPQQQQPTTTNSTLSSMEIILISVAGGLFLLILLILVVVYIRRRRNTPNMGDGISGGKGNRKGGGDVVVTQVSTSELDDQAAWHSRRKPSGDNNNEDGANVPGSLASTDFLALKPQYLAKLDESYRTKNSEGSNTVHMDNTVDKTMDVSMDTAASPPSVIIEEGEQGDRSYYRRSGQPTTEEVLADLNGSDDEESNGSVVLRQLNKIAEIPTDYGTEYSLHNTYSSDTMS